MQVQLDLSHNNAHLVIFTKDNPWCVPTQKGWLHSRGIFEWDLPKVLSQGGAELHKCADERRFSSELDVVKSSKDADS